MIFCTQDLLQKLHFHQAVLWALWFVHKKRFLVNPQNLEDRTKTKSWYFSLKLDRTPTIVYLTEKSATLTHQSRNPKGRCWMSSSSSLDRKKPKTDCFLGSLAAWCHNTTYAKLKWQKKIKKLAIMNLYPSEEFNHFPLAWHPGGSTLAQPQQRRHPQWR